MTLLQLDLKGVNYGVCGQKKLCISVSVVWLVSGRLQVAHEWLEERAWGSLVFEKRIHQRQGSLIGNSSNF